MSSLNKVEIGGVEYDLYGYGGDVLPIGTEVEILNSVSVPAGWEEVEYDTGWVDLEIDTSVVSLRDPEDEYYGEYYKPQVRRIGDVVYCKGNVTWTSAHKSGEIFTTLPEKFRPTYEIKFASGLWLGGSGTICTNYNEVNWVDMSGSWVANSVNTKKIRKITQVAPPIAVDDYSEDEIVIGTWLGKPLYRKVFIEDSPPTKNTIGYLSYAGNDIEEVVRFNGIARADGIGIPINFYYSTETYMYAHDESAENRIKYKYTAWDFTKITFVLEYTKTTDVANS